MTSDEWMTSNECLLCYPSRSTQFSITCDLLWTILELHQTEPSFKRNYCHWRRFWNLIIITIDNSSATSEYDNIVHKDVDTYIAIALTLSELQSACVRIKNSLTIHRVFRITEVKQTLKNKQTKEKTMVILWMTHQNYFSKMPSNCKTWWVSLVVPS